MRNFLQIAQGIQVMPVLMQLYGQPQLWSEDRIRQEYAPDSPHKDAEDVLLRFSPHEGIGDAIQCDWTPSARLLPAAVDLSLLVMALVRGEQLGRVMITRLSPGKSIAPHADVLGKYADFYTRYHIPLVSDPGVVFSVGDESINMEPGGIWWFNGHEYHNVVNNSARDRLNLIVDVRTLH